jgi:hypothetical protein
MREKIERESTTEIDIDGLGIEQMRESTTEIDRRSTD